MPPRTSSLYALVCIGRGGGGAKNLAIETKDSNTDPFNRPSELIAIRYSCNKNWICRHVINCTGVRVTLQLIIKYRVWLTVNQLRPSMHGLARIE